MPSMQILVALAMTRAGDTARAPSMAYDLHKRSPLSTPLDGYWLPTIRASIELKRKHPDKAVDLLQEALPYELGASFPEAQTSGTLYPVYVRGEAYLKQDKGRRRPRSFRSWFTIAVS